MVLTQFRPDGPAELFSSIIDDPFFIDLATPQFVKWNRWFNGGRGTLDFCPAMNVIEREKEVIIELAAPGLSSKDFHIKIDGDLMIVSVEKDKEIEKETYQEFGYNNFRRTIDLPDTIDHEKEVKANYREGILFIVFQKRENGKKKMKQIEIS